MINEHLQSGIDIEICHESRQANNFTNRLTIYLRVLRKITDYMNLAWTDIPDMKTNIYLEDTLRQYITEHWMSQNASTCSEPNEEMEKLIAKDYIKPLDMTRFVLLLQRREMKQTVPMMHKIYQLLGMDGFMGMSDLKRYVEYLKYQQADFRGVHVRAVRELYEKIPNPSVEKVFDILNMAYGWKNCECPDDVELKHFYTNLVNDKFETIMEWKHHQLQEESKRKETGGGKKRKSNPSNKKDVIEPRKRSRKSATPVKKISVTETKKTSIPDDEQSSSESGNETENSHAKDDEESSSESDNEIES